MLHVCVQSVCVYIAAIGSENRMIIDPIDIFSMAISCKARKVFLAHNHTLYTDVPDDNKDTELKLSKQDFNFTNKLYHACLSFGITIIDHIILGDNIYYSLGENKYMIMIHKDKTYKTYKVLQPKLDKEKEDAKLDSLKVGRKEGVAAGKMLGLVEGEAKGIDKGKDIGKQERNIEIAQTMLKNNVDIDIIISSTGLSKKEILKIKKDMGL